MDILYVDRKSVTGARVVGNFTNFSIGLEGGVLHLARDSGDRRVECIQEGKQLLKTWKSYAEAEKAIGTLFPHLH